MPGPTRDHSSFCPARLLFKLPQRMRLFLNETFVLDSNFQIGIGLTIEFEFFLRIKNILECIILIISRR